MERADSTSRVLDIKYHILLPSGEQVGGTVDVTQWMAVLRSCRALEAFLRISHGQVTSWEVAEFLILHDSFPRSLRFCVDALDAALHQISGCDRSHFSSDAERLSGMLRSNLDNTPFIFAKAHPKSTCTSPGGWLNGTFVSASLPAASWNMLRVSVR